MNPLPGKIRDLALDTRLVYAIIFANLAGTAFGFYYYLPQFSETPIYLWILVADSPIATLLMAGSLFLYSRNIKSSLIDGLAFVSNLKYGLWTAFVLLFYFESFWQMNSTPLYLFLLFSHLAMALQIFLISDYGTFSWKDFGLAALWFLTNDYQDYSMKIHSTLPVELEYFWNPASIVAVSLTILGLLLYLREVGPELPPPSDLLQRLG